MSYSEIITLKKCKRNIKPAKILREFKNSHGIAPVVWESMYQKYVPNPQMNYMFDADRLWPIYKNKDMPMHHKSVLLMTYDYAYVERKNFIKAASDIKKWLKDFPQNENRVNHWFKISEIFKRKPKCKMIGFYMTSLSDNSFEKSYGHKRDKRRGACKKLVFEVYEELEILSLKG